MAFNDAVSTHLADLFFTFGGPREVSILAISGLVDDSSQREMWLLRMLYVQDFVTLHVVAVHVTTLRYT